MGKLRQIKEIGGHSKYITLPKEWGNIDDYINFEILNENEIKLKKMTVIPKS